jgi:hypothetical protein
MHVRSGLQTCRREVQEWPEWTPSRPKTIVLLSAYTLDIEGGEP